MPRLSGIYVSAVATLVVTLTAGIAHGDDAATFQSLMGKAVQAKNAGDLARAATLLGEAYRIRPAPELLNNMGKLYEGLGRWQPEDGSHPSIRTSRYHGLEPIYTVL